MSDDPSMPDVARRKAGKDTLFSADWFDAEDDFGKGHDKNVDDETAEAAPKPAPAPAPAAPTEGIPGPAASSPPPAPKKKLSAPLPAERSGPSPLLIVGVLLIGLILGGGLVAIAGLVAIYLFLL